MPGEVDRPGCDVDVHDPVDDLALEVALVLVDDILLPSIVELDKCQVALRLLGDGLINLLVVADPLQEVDDGLVGLHPLVVRTVDLDLPHVGLDNVIRGADTLEEDALEVILDDYPGEHIVPPLPGGVGRVKDGHVSVARLEPVDGVLQGVLHALLPDGLGTRVVWVKEVVFWFLGLVLVDVPPIVSGIEHPGVDPDPVEVPGELLGDVCLTPGGEADHDNDLTHSAHAGPGGNRHGGHYSSETITTQMRQNIDIVYCVVEVVLLIIRTTSVLLDFTCLVSEACVWWGAAMQPLTGGDAGVVIGAILLVCVTAVPDVPDYNVSARMSWFYLQDQLSVSAPFSSTLARPDCAVPPPPAQLSQPATRRGETVPGSYWVIS